VSFYLQLVAVAIPLITGTIATFHETKSRGRLNRWGWSILLINVLATVLAGVTLAVERSEQARADALEARAAADKEQLEQQERQLAEQQRKLEAQADKAWAEYAARKIAQVYLTLTYRDDPNNHEALRKLAMTQFVFRSNVAPEDGSASAYIAVAGFQVPQPGQPVDAMVVSPALRRGGTPADAMAFTQATTLKDGATAVQLAGTLAWAGMNMGKPVPSLGSLGDLSELKVLLPQADPAKLDSASVSFELANGQTVQYFFDPASFRVDIAEEITGFHHSAVTGDTLLRLVEERFRATVDKPEQQKWLTATIRPPAAD
jgi:hypothetical protein